MTFIFVGAGVGFGDLPAASGHSLTGTAPALGNRLQSLLAGPVRINRLVGQFRNGTSFAVLSQRKVDALGASAYDQDEGPDAMTKRSPHESDLHKPLLFQKVGVFVDAENIELSGLKHHGGRTDYRRILDKVGDREIIRILYYKPIYKEISSTFQSFWKGLGGEIKQPSKNADSFLIIDAVTLAEKMDVAIILGGDKDYLPLVWYLKSRGCRVEIWSWPEATSPDVKEAADVYFPLTVDFVVTGEAPQESTKTAVARAAPISGSTSGAVPVAAVKPAPAVVAKPIPVKVEAVKPEIEKRSLAAAAPVEAEGVPKKRRRGSRGGRRRSGRATKNPSGQNPADESDSPEEGSDTPSED